MIYFIDGSLEGLFSGIFLGYKDIQEIQFFEKSMEQSFLEDQKFIDTNLEYSNRVKKSIIDNFGYGFLSDIKSVLKSDSMEKYTILARVIKGCYIYGMDYLNCSSDETVMYNGILRNFYRECHAYKGLLRFQESKDKILVAEFEPINDILDIMITHFKKRMPEEKFIIIDKKRKKAKVYDGKQVLEYNDLDFNYDRNSKDYFVEECWKEFYNAVKIEERNNPNLMQSNMPKRYWKYLPEKKQ